MVKLIYTYARSYPFYRPLYLDPEVCQILLGRELTSAGQWGDLGLELPLNMEGDAIFQLAEGDLSGGQAVGDILQH